MLCHAISSEGYQNLGASLTHWLDQGNHHPRITRAIFLAGSIRYALRVAVVFKMVVFLVFSPLWFPPWARIQRRERETWSRRASPWHPKIILFEILVDVLGIGRLCPLKMGDPTETPNNRCTTYRPQPPPPAIRVRLPTGAGAPEAAPPFPFFCLSAV